jgi:formylglycine-generating enzyme required for sulfatase activity/predicted Ser/Thr protein kinase
MLTQNSVLQNRYLIVRQIGQGGMGAVYLARDQRLNNDVAIKETFANTDRLRRAFEQEAQLLAALRHPALPVVSDHFVEGDGQFLVMQFIAGNDLETLLHRQGYAFSPREVIEWADQLLDALDYLHTQEPPIIHRDIKPQNLKLTERGQIVLLDFGLAKGQVIAEIGAPLSVLGYTPNYAPLEQIKGQGTDARSDLYSLAATLYYLLTASMPADAIARVEALAHGQTDPLRRAEEINPHVPLHISNVLQRSLSINRERRFASSREMKSALHSVSQSLTQVYESESPAFAGQTSIPTSVMATPPSALQSSETKQVQTEGPRPKKLRVAGAGILLVLVGAAIAVALWPASRPSAPELKTFDFNTPSIDLVGKLVSERKGRARSFTEDLGDGVAIEMVEVPGGAFFMGSLESEEKREKTEGPQQQVSVGLFFIGKYEITQAQWRAVARLPKVARDLITEPSSFKGDNLPVEQVSWEDAMEFCSRLSAKTGRAYRLPSESEWEYACRGGSTNAFGFGENINSDLVNFNGDGPYRTAPRTLYRDKTVEVGSLGYANGFGLHDLHGNVSEWVGDLWHDSYQGAPVDGSVWESGGDPKFRILRGGSWYVQAFFCRAASRYKTTPDLRDYNAGFRVALSGGSLK